MTKGKALNEARAILGDSGHVRYDPSLPYPYKVGTFSNHWEGVACGRTWEEALKDTRKARRQ